MAKRDAKKDSAKKERVTEPADFVGRWELDPTQSKFQLEQVPKAATLDIKKEKGGMFMRLEWTDSESKQGELEHGFTFDKPVLVNGNEMTLVHHEDGSLETIVQKDGAELSRTRRTLSKDRKTMELTQAGTLPNKQAFSNVSVYRRVK